MQKLSKALVLAGFTGLSLVSGIARAQAPAPEAQTAPAAAPAAPAEPTPEHTFAVKFALYSEYEYRGISQTSEKPALQMNLDYTHSSGLYLGTFLSNIKWLKDTAEVNGLSTSADIEWDIYGGYRFEVAKDTTVDVGYLRYEYPSSGAFNPKPNTDEIYAGITWQWLNLKYSYSINNTFGVPDSKGSYYIESNINYPIESVKGLTLTGTLAYQDYAHNKPLSYTVWKAGAVYDFGNGWNIGAYYKGTDAEEALYTIKGKDWSKDRLVAFGSYSF
jgi:uncharacterized protein (TIGR02001 family)